MSTANFHAQRLGLIKTHTYGCSCGCNSCGSEAYGNDYGSRYWLPGGMPDWNYSFWGRNKYRSGACPEYDKAVKAFQKAAAEYDALERNWYGNIKDDKKKNKIIARAKKAQAEGKAAQNNCKQMKRVGEGKYAEDAAAMTAGRQERLAQESLNAPADAAAPAAPVQTVSADTTQQSGGGSNTMLFVGIGAVVLVGGALFAFKKGKKKKKVAPAAAPAPAVTKA